MTVRHLQVERICIVSQKSFADVLACTDALLGHPEMMKFRRDLAEAKTEADLSRLIENAVGPSGLMEFARFDLGHVIRMTGPNHGAKILRLVVGNPLVMAQMVGFASDAGSYAPVTILIDERPDGIHLSYDRVESFIAPYGSVEAQRTAHDLDAKVEQMLKAVAE
jgi:hypothetical protein